MFGEMHVFGVFCVFCGGDVLGERDRSYLGRDLPRPRVTVCTRSCPFLFFAFCRCLFVRQADAVAERELAALAAAAAARDREMLMEEADSLEDGYTSEDNELYRALDASTVELPSRGSTAASGAGRMGAGGGGGASRERPTSVYARSFFEDSEVTNRKQETKGCCRAVVFCFLVDFC